jgi:hypothetical protein
MLLHLYLLLLQILLDFQLHMYLALNYYLHLRHHHLLM